jgi:hypothetical protein
MPIANTPPTSHGQALFTGGRVLPLAICACSGSKRG